jgi:hypothetical protein
MCHALATASAAATIPALPPTMSARAGGRCHTATHGRFVGHLAHGEREGTGAARGEGTRRGPNPSATT